MWSSRADISAVHMFCLWGATEEIWSKRKVPLKGDELKQLFLDGGWAEPHQGPVWVSQQIIFTISQSIRSFFLFL